MQKIVFFLAVFSIILLGCTNNGDSKVEPSNVGNPEQLTESIEQLEIELERKQSIISELENENEKLKGLLDKEDSQDKSQMLVVQEGLYINPDVLYPEEITEEVIVNLLGEPLNSKEFVGAHGGFNEVELTYDSFSITIQKQPKKQLVKWLTINDSNFVTERGITVGSSKSQVIQAYGRDFSEDTNSIFYGEKTGMRFTLEDDYVKEIVIWYMYE